MENKLSKLLKLQPDVQLHLNGAFFWSWLIVIMDAFTNETGVLITIILGILLSIAWEFIGMKKGKPFSFKDVFVFIIGLIPVCSFVLKFMLND